MKKNKARIVYQSIIHIILLLGAFCILFPFVLLFISSITDEQMIILNGYSLFPKKLSFEAYQYILNGLSQILRAYGVTIFITIVGTFFHILISSLLAYPLSMKNLPLKRFFTFMLFFTMLFNGGLVPSYLMYTQIFHIKNTIFALIVPGLLMNAMNVLLIRTYYITSIPEALIEAAQIDGAGIMKIYFTMILPLSKPILVTVGLFAALGYWNDWTNGLYYITNPNMFSMQNLLNRMINEIQFLTNNSLGTNTSAIASTIPSATIRMAIAFVAIIPMLMIFPFLQKYFEKGIAVGAVKG